MANQADLKSQTLSLPKGGGAIKGIGETFQANLFSGTGNFSIPIAFSPGRAGFGPELTLQYSTGNGNSPFGLGWQLSIPRITRKTEKGLPKYTNEDVFVMSGAEDLVPKTKPGAPDIETVTRGVYTITRYRPRTEGLFARIEKWADKQTGDIHWRATTKDNLTSIYGRTSQARIVDPNNENRIYEWLLQETFDAKGNHILYEYARDHPDLDLGLIHEENRSYCQKYIRRVYFGNLPRDENGNELLYEDGVTKIGPQREGLNHLDQISKTNRRYAFEVVFDYGDWDITASHLDAGREGSQEQFGAANPPLRQDPFSSFRAGFEIRTLRRCQRVLMYHHFKELGGPTLVKSTDFNYVHDPQTMISMLSSATVTGYKKENGVYVSAGMPPVAFNYSEFKPHEQKYEPVANAGNDMPPRSLQDPETTLVDLFGDGLPDVLSATATGAYYWRNLGNAELDMRRSQDAAPDGLSLALSGVAFGDMAGDGMVDLIVQWPETSGFYEATPDGGYKPFKKFDAYPSFDLADPNVRLVDLTGDGRSDVLMTGDLHFLWFECKGEQGYAEPLAVSRKHDLNQFPHVYFNDPSGRVRLADMTGDGLNDIVLLHDGRVDYWPNLGYGRFGKRITMTGSPRLEYNYDSNRLFLADLDGSGCADMVYVNSGKVHFWLNRSGNGWCDEQVILGTPPVTDRDAVQFADIFGTGTAALIWSYDYHYQRDSNYKALDFCGGVKPYVLNEMNNNLGATTKVHYAPSTKFYLEDREANNPWATNLPFPVHVVEKVEVIDHISKTKLVTTYKYHHGYYDGREREFRGFGRVDQYDTEIFDDFSQAGLHNDDQLFSNKDRAFHAPPVVTKTWFHTGVYYDEDKPAADGSPFDHHKLMQAYQKEYYNKDAQAFELSGHLFVSDPDAPPTDTPHEIFRALRGAVLRSEVYAADDSEKAGHPYLVTQTRYQVKEIQPKGSNRHAVYLTAPKESVSYHYERNPLDPRIGQNIVLGMDGYGHVTDSLSIAYPRRQAPPELPEQAELKMIYTKTDYINKADEPEYYHLGVPCQTRTFEVTGVNWSPGDPLLKPEIFTSVIDDPFAAGSFQPFEWQRPQGHVGLEKRIIEWQRSYFRTDANVQELDITLDLENHPNRTLRSRLALGEIERLALPYESYTAASTDDLLAQCFSGRANVTPTMLLEGGYHQEPDTEGYWWIPGGQQSFDPQKFYLVQIARDPFAMDSHVAYDSYALSAVKTADALGNKTYAKINYRVLQPEQVTGPNGNHAFAAFDVLGLVVGTAVRSKTGEGDTLGDRFVSDLSDQQIQAFFKKPTENGAALLAGATSRMIYDLWAYQRGEEASPGSINPPVVATLSREIHDSDLNNNETSPIQQSFLYSDGFGRTLQSKIQAEPDSSTPDQARWVGSGTTLFNNKGKPVRQYEPFFSDTHAYGIERHGVSPTLFYDPLERVVCTLNPNHTYAKVVFDPWHQATWDVNDTVLQADPKRDGDVGAFFVHLPTDAYLPTWHEARKDGQMGGAEKTAAEKTAVHADTPGVAHLDTLGRTFLTLEHNRFERNGAIVEEIYETRVELDIEGNQLKVIDARDRIVMQYDYNIAGGVLRQDSMDAGARWTLNNAAGNPLYAWDSRNHRFHTIYDELQRATHLWVETDPGREILAERTVYGEKHPQAEALNLRGQVWFQLDGAGMAASGDWDPGTQPEKTFDFKGNLLQSNRRFAIEYKERIDWAGVEAALRGEVLDRRIVSSTLAQYLDANLGFTTKTTYDALNRVVTQTTPDNSITRPLYNEANLLNKIDVQLRGEPQASSFIRNIDYDAKGQRTLSEYGNGVITEYEYDKETFRLVHLKTTRSGFPANEQIVQDLHYTYDPTGNISTIRDHAQQTIYFNNAVAEPHTQYWYDAIYRLIKAHGREHLGQTGGHLNPPVPTSPSDAPRAGLPHPNDGGAMGNYEEKYDYDEVGNILELHHRVLNTPPPIPDRWVRKYDYQEPSLIEHNKTNNRLSTTRIGSETLSYEHDIHGNMTKMPHLELMKWDFEDQLQMIDRNGGGKAWYVYDAGGQRVRKIIEKNNGSLTEERIYLGGFELYRKRLGGNVTLERETLHIMDDTKRIAMIETKTIDTRNDPSPTQLIRYQFGNHLGSASLELDDQGQIISYEEYYPYGSTSYQAVRNLTENPKRYRYIGKERDEETGFFYYGARYYAAWLGRWTSTDPSGLIDGVNLFLFVKNSPISLLDRFGEDSSRFTHTGGAGPGVDPAVEEEHQKQIESVQLKKEIEKQKEIARKLLLRAEAEYEEVKQQNWMCKYQGDMTFQEALEVYNTSHPSASMPDPEKSELYTKWALRQEEALRGFKIAAESPLGGTAAAIYFVLGGKDMRTATFFAASGQLLESGAPVVAGGVASYKKNRYLKPKRKILAINMVMGIGLGFPLVARETKAQAHARHERELAEYTKKKSVTFIPEKVHLHHLATDKDPTYWTPLFVALFESADMSLQHKANLVRVVGHKGPHPYDYHKFIYTKLVTAVEGKTGEARKQALINELYNLKRDAQRKTSLIYILITR